VVLKGDGLTQRTIQPPGPEQNGPSQRADRTLRQAWDGGEPSNYLELERILVSLTRQNKEERLHSSLGSLPTRERYHRDPQSRFEHRRLSCSTHATVARSAT
jgi:hypothetical protein